MGLCRYCHQPAGFLRRQHKECRAAHDQAVSKLLEFFSQLFNSDIPTDRFSKLAANIAAKYFLTADEFRDVTLRGLTELIENALGDRILSHDEENRIANLQKSLGVTTNDLPAPVGNKLIKSAILRDLDEGVLRSRIQLDGSLPINLERGENIIWILKNVTYSKFRTQTQYVGGSRGLSIRIMKGLSYRVGSYRGHTIKSEQLVTEGSGYLAVGTRNLYFVASGGALRIPLKKIVGLQPYSDGIAITQSGVNAKTQLFALDDPMFVANAISKLNQL